MTTATLQQDTITVPKNLWYDFVSEFDKMKKVYELMDHMIAEREVKQNDVKTFTNVKDFFDDLDN